MEAMEGTKRTARRIVVGGLAVISTAFLGACLGDSPTSSSGGGSVPVSVSVAVPRAVSGPASIGPSPSITIADGENTLVMDQMEIVIRGLVLKRDDVSSCAGAGSGCIEYLPQAAVVPLPDGQGAFRLITRTVSAARYDRLDMQLHAPSADEPVTDDNPEFEGVSVRVSGTFNEEPFEFTADVTTDETLQLDPALTVLSGTPAANVTILVVVTNWFRTQDGAVVDPRTAEAGGENEGLVESNIRASVEAFRDDDLDGTPGSGGL